jgi:hypothetical protein
MQDRWTLLLTSTASVNAQVNEMQLVREKVYQMEQTHITLKQKYVQRLVPLLLTLSTHGDRGSF